ncbi:polysaccharide pyruvyl transferase family protein [Microbulbifer sp. MCCC 1A16149]|uniref:polysaccharide pyruvyl transferase family protein n=1 Tax=Microbulbifer sp. MCCC 1A16149 TaxID=3411322 RepID=UPI003D0CF02F
MEVVIQSTFSGFKMNKYFISLRTQFPNLGDLLINRALLEEVLERGEVYVDVSGVPSWYLSIILNSLPCKNIRVRNVLSFYTSFLYSLALNIFKRESSTFLLLKPGGYMAITSLEVALRRGIHGASLHIWRLLGANIVRAPSSQRNSIGIFRYIDKFRLSAVSSSLIRDVISEEEMQDLTIPFLSSYDLAILFFALPRHSLFKPQSNECASRSRLAISFRKPRTIEEENHYLDIAEHLSGEVRTVQFVSQVFYDDEINSRLAQSFGAQFVQYLGTVNSIEDVVNQYEVAEFVISNRLHVLLLALLNGAIPIAVVGDEDSKIEGFFAKLGMHNFVYRATDAAKLDLSKVRSEWREELYGQIVRQAELLKNQLYEVLSK